MLCSVHADDARNHPNRNTQSNATSAMLFTHCMTGQILLTSCLTPPDYSMLQEELEKVRSISAA